jgi:hypothetical protein
MQQNYIYLLIDANLLAGYYAPQTMNENSKPAAEKIKNIIDSVRNNGSTYIKLLAPEICVAETQTVLSKYSNVKWRSARKIDHPNAIHGKTYKIIIDKMRKDLHGGNLIESIPLQRYHVLAKHLITPIDHNMKMTQHELGGTDQLICGMAIWLTRLIGHDRFFVLTADFRLAEVLKKAQRLTDKQAITWGIKDKAEKDIGFQFSKEIYPRSIYLPTASEKDLRRILGAWPLPTKKRRTIKNPRPVKLGEIEELFNLYKNIGVGRDNLPYTEKMKLLVEQFNNITGLSLSELNIWRLLVTRLKKGDGSLRKKTNRPDGL